MVFNIYFSDASGGLSHDDDELLMCTDDDRATMIMKWAHANFIGLQLAA